MKVAFWTLLVAGFIACGTVGLGPALRRAGGSWTSPWIVGGSLVGLAIVALAVAFATGWRPVARMTDSCFVVTLAGLVGVKVGISVAQQVVARLAG